MTEFNGRSLLLWQGLLGLGLLAGWEWAGWTFGDVWTSRPSLIAIRLGQLLQGELYRHLAVTIGEIVIGLGIGFACGVLAGLWLGYSRVLGTILRPLIVTLYNIPLITLAPLLMLWFGFGMESKIVLVSISSFFIVFFNTFSGAREVDTDMLRASEIMGATSMETFAKVVCPGAMAWVLAGLKIALPYSIVAATTGEMLAAREGLGSLLANAASAFDMTGVYTILLILMVLGMLAAEIATRTEHAVLRWRHAGR